jgi:hypothetical protein
MNDLTDNPWPLILLLLAVPVIAFMTGSSKSGLIAVVCLLLCAGLYFLEQYLVSPGEEVEAELFGMLDDFKSRDLDAIRARISPGNPQLMAIAERGLDLVDLSDSFHIRDAAITIDDANHATALVRANGTVSLRTHGGGSRHVATYWRTVWEKENGCWRLKDVRRLNLTTGEEQDYFSTSLNSPRPRLSGSCRLRQAPVLIETAGSAAFSSIDCVDRHWSSSSPAICITSISS